MRANESHPPSKKMREVLNADNYIKCTPERGFNHNPQIITEDPNVPIENSLEPALTMSGERTFVRLVALVICTECEKRLVWDTKLRIPKLWIDSDGKKNNTTIPKNSNRA